MDYDFSQLNDKEFESLSLDLLGKELNTRIERFKPGKDSGIDGRFFTKENGAVIIQCKHYVKSGFKQLLSKMKRDEIKKVALISPERYILITSVPLSPNNKNKLKEVMSPYINSDTDIYGKDDLNYLLSNFTEIEEKYFKLWLSSTTVLRTILNRAIKGRSTSELDLIAKKAELYVQTQAHTDSLNILKEKNILIITGEPGIGKTTLAENLSLFFVSREYEFIVIEESISEAESVYSLDKPQIFLFDDFLGSNYFEAIAYKKDSHIVKFIERVKKDKGKKFILTSRTNILRNGIEISSVLKNKNLAQNEYLIEVTRYSQMDKARILYNHIWHSGLDDEYIEEFYRDRNYWKIIGHKNYNPRLIEFITDVDRIDIEVDKFWEFVLDKLNNPHDIWSQAFKIQTTARIRNIVMLVVYNGGQIDEITLRAAFNRICANEELRNDSIEYDFNLTIRLSVRSFLNRYITDNIIIYRLFNPSITDFIVVHIPAKTDSCFGNKRTAA